MLVHLHRNQNTGWPPLFTGREASVLALEMLREASVLALDMLREVFYFFRVVSVLALDMLREVSIFPCGLSFGTVVSVWSQLFV
jgi:hypothetical protein